MAMVELYSNRQKRIRGEVLDVYTYDQVPQSVRVQIIHIWRDALGREELYRTYSPVREVYQGIVSILCREYGMFQLPHTNQRHGRDYLNELFNYFINESSVDRHLDVIELTFRLIDSSACEHLCLPSGEGRELADKAIEELNHRFKEQGIGYQFTNNELIRVDSEFIHAETVKPALRLLNESGYAGAQEEFLGAYEHYRKGNNKEALNDCLKSFESAMQAICDKRGWTYPTGATARPLIRTCFDNKLIPEFWDQQFNSLRSLLESSVPTGRNKLGGHGQGSQLVSVPDYLAAYMLHMTASALVFLTTAEKELP